MFSIRADGCSDNKHIDCVKIAFRIWIELMAAYPHPIPTDIYNDVTDYADYFVRHIFSVGVVYPPPWWEYVGQYYNTPTTYCHARNIFTGEPCTNRTTARFCRYHEYVRVMMRYGYKALNADCRMICTESSSFAEYIIRREYKEIFRYGTDDGHRTWMQALQLVMLPPPYVQIKYKTTHNPFITDYKRDDEIVVSWYERQQLQRRAYFGDEDDAEETWWSWLKYILDSKRIRFQQWFKLRFFPTVEQPEESWD